MATQERLCDGCKQPVQWCECAAIQRDEIRQYGVFSGPCPGCGHEVTLRGLEACPYCGLRQDEH